MLTNQIADRRLSTAAATPRPPWTGEAQREPLLVSGSTAFVARAQQARSPSLFWHHHPELELTYVESGSGLRFVGNAVAPFTDGDLCLIRGGTPHGYAWSPRLRRVRWIVLQLDPSRWGNDFWALPELRGLADLVSGTRAGVSIRGRVSEVIVHRLKRLTRTAPLVTRGLGTVVEILEMAASGTGQTPLGRIRRDDGARAVALRGDERLEELLASLESHIAEPLSRREIADRLGMSPSAFSRWFRQRTGRTFQRHRTELRVVRACSLLATSNRTITEIAYACGFGNLANFNRRFREIVNATPRRYRAGSSAGDL